MNGSRKSKERLLQENELLRERLEEAEAALDAIRSGEVDALVISSPDGEQIFTLQGAEHPYRVMVETMNEGAATVLEDGSILYANRRLAEMLKVPLETLVGSSLIDYIVSKDDTLLDGLIEQGFTGSSRGEIHLLCSDFSNVPVLISFSPTEVDGARALSLVAADLTEQKRNEELLAAERLTRSILEQAGEAILVCDTAGRIIRANDAALRTCPRNPIFKPFETGLPLTCKEPVDAGRCFSINNLLEGDSFQGIEVELATSQGGNRFFLLSAAPLLKDQDEIIGGIITLTEITERKLAEEALRASEGRLVAVVEALRESEHRFRTLADGTPVIIWVTDAAGRIEFVNRAYSEFFGVSISQVQSEGWQPLVHPNDAAGYSDVFKDCLLNRRPFRAQARVRSHDGQWRWIDSDGQPRLSDSGEFLGMAGSSLDITEQKQAEKAIQEYALQLERSNKELQDFAFIASHDLKEPLRKVQAFGDLLNKKYSPVLTDEGSLWVERMINAASRMQTMLNDLLNYSRVTTKANPFVSVNLRDILSEVLSDLDFHLEQSRGKVELDCLPVVEADPMQMRMLFQNLITNALKFYREGVPPVVTVYALTGETGNGDVQTSLPQTSLPQTPFVDRRSEVGEESPIPYSVRSEASPTPLSSDLVQIIVEDNGIGFDEKYADLIFQPFQRLHGRSEYTGNGMGLAICRKITQRHGGTITAHSAPGQGARFIVTLPARQNGNSLME